MTLTRKLAVLGISGLITGLVTYAAPAGTRAAESPQVVKITASRFHFTPDRITLVKGQPVTLQLTSTDRTHGFMVKPLGIDTDTTICDHYCGLGHTSMKMTIVVQ